jgi:predicted DNA-binding protein
MINVKIVLPKKLEEHLNYLAVASKRRKDFIIREALIRYLEDAEDLAKVFEKERKKGDKTFTTEELLQHLNLKEVSV